MEQKSSVLKALISLQLQSQVAQIGHQSALQKDIESDLVKYQLGKNRKKKLAPAFNSLAVALSTGEKTINGSGFQMGNNH